MAKRGNGEGTIRENKARNRWEGRLTIGFTDEGRPIRKMVTGPTRKSVVKGFKDIQDAADAGRSVAPKALTVGQFLDEWVAFVLPGSVAPSTAVHYETVVRLWVKPHLGRKRLASLTPTDVARMLKTMEDEGKSPNTRRLARAVLRRALRWAELDGIVTRNVAGLVDGVKLKAVEGRTFLPDQARHLLVTLDGHRMETAFCVALTLGLRPGEVLGLAWSDLELDAGQARLTVRHSLKRDRAGQLVVDETKTSRSRRTVHLPDPLVGKLRDHRRRQVADRLKVGPQWPTHPLGVDLVFRTPDGLAFEPGAFRRLTYKVTVDAGLGRWSPHELRHSAASLMLAQGVPLKTVSETLGHSSIAVTADVYGHLMEPARTDAATAMGAVLWGSQ